MIDWATAIVYAPHYRHQVDNGLLLRTGPDGSVETRRELAMNLRGSHSATTLVHSHLPEQQLTGPLGVATTPESDLRYWLRIDGNPSKWRYGHNCFGTDDPDLILWWIIDVCRRLGIQPQPRTARLTRIDVTKSYRLDSPNDVDTWLRTAEKTVTMKYRGRGNLVKGGTLYFGKNSRRSTFKLYNKKRELQERRLHPDLPNRDLIEQWTAGILRAEACFRSPHLKKYATDKLSKLTTATIQKLYTEQFSKLNLPMTDMTTTDLTDIPKSALSSFHLWKSGHDMQSILTRRTFYRHRAMLLNFDIDIAIPCDDPDRQIKVRVLHARAASVPDWASDSEFLLAA